MAKKFFTVIQHGYFPFGKGESVDEALRNSAENLEMTPEEVLQAFYGDEDGNYPTEEDANAFTGRREIMILDGRGRELELRGYPYLMECSERFFQYADTARPDSFMVYHNVVVTSDEYDDLGS